MAATSAFLQGRGPDPQQLDHFGLLAQTWGHQGGLIQPTASTDIEDDGGLFLVRVSSMQQQALSKQLQRCFSGLGESFSYSLLIFGPYYCAQRKAVRQLVNFISGTPKLAIWKTRKNRVRGQESEDVVSVVSMDF